MSERNTRVATDVRVALLRKYRLLCSWRRGKDRSFEAGAHESTEGLASRADLRTLSEEFPGALRELDRLGLPELERRVAVLATADDPDEPNQPDEEWIAWIASYHAIMRGVLAHKRGQPGGSPLSEARPPEGKLSLAVLREVSRRFDRPVVEIAATLFPARTGRAAESAP